MLRKYLLLYGRPLILFLYISGVYYRWYGNLYRSWERAGKRILYPPFTLSFLKGVYTTFSNKVGIRAALKNTLEFPHLSFNRLWGSDFASRIPHAKLVEPRWPGDFNHLPMALRAAGSKAWAWRMKTIIPVVGLAVFAYWFGALVQEFSVSPPALVRQSAPPAVADPGTDPKGWVDVPRPMIVIRPEVVHEPTPVPGTPEPTVTETPTPPVPKLSVTQIFARLDRGEITVAETKALLAAKSFVPYLDRSRSHWPED